MSRLVREELTRVESEVALCRKCFGRAPRHVTRLERPRGRGRILVLCERPSRSVLQADARFGLRSQDPTSRALRRRVEDAGIPPGEVIVGASVMCRPETPELESALPPSFCATECLSHVRELVCAAQPRLIVPLGATALRSFRRAFPEQRRLRRMRFPGAVGQTWVAGATFIHPLYHVSSRARVTRPEPEQKTDWQRLARLWDWISSGETGTLPRGMTLGGAKVDTGRPDV